MAYNGKKKLSGKALVDETIDLWKRYGDKRDGWAEHAKEDKEFRLGRQWTQEQEDILNARGQAPLVVNRILPLYPYPSLGLDIHVNTLNP